MNKNTKTAGIVITSLTLFCALFMSFSMGKNVFALPEETNENGYVLNLGSEKNKANMTRSMKMKANDPTGYNGTFSAVTSDGNTIAFAYNNMSFSSGWGTFDGESSLYNTTSICGMTSLYLEFTNSTDTLKLAYGWIDSETGTIDYQVDDVILSQSSSTFNFYGDEPDAFKIYNEKKNKDIKINNIVVNYSCSRSVNPYGSADLNNFTYIYSSVNEDYTIQSYKGNSENVVIPSKIFDGSHSAIVTAIEDNAFEYSYSMTSITLPHTLETIGDNAFYACDRLASINIPDNVTSIGDGAFTKCYNLTSISLSDSLESISDNSFLSCQRLTSIDIPSSVTSIGDSAFKYCYALESVTLSNGLQNIADNAFISCQQLTSINIPSTVTSIGANAFMYCYNMQSITFSNGLQTIGANAFNSCQNVTSLVIPQSVTSIGDNAFANTWALEYAVIPTSVIHLGNSAFAPSNWSSKFFCQGSSLPSTWSTSAFRDSSTQVYFYSATQNSDGHHWHYVDNAPTIW
ncbi:MAG: leucine-rich repeat domain-containing protein [Bacilli bacterium]